MSLPFVKAHGIGNDFVLVDRLRELVEEGGLPQLSRSVCDRTFGVGADGLILLEAGVRCDFRMRMLNPDGSESEMCGNGLRCFALFLRDGGYWDGSGAVEVETEAGVLRPEILADGRVRVDMGLAQLTGEEIGMAGVSGRFVEGDLGFGGLRGTAVGMGNPHLVVYVEDAGAVDLAGWGGVLERHELFPERVNVHFVQVLAEGRVVQRTWERGAGATLACGTGACAVAVAGFLTGRTGRRLLSGLPGGELELEYGADGRVWMTGPAVVTFRGEWLGRRGEWPEED